MSQTQIYHHLSPRELMKHILERQEGVLSANQAIQVTTGKRTGRSPKDRYIVEDSITKNTVNWGAINQPIDEKKFQEFWLRAEKYLQDKTLFENRYHVGAHDTGYLPLTVTTELAWHQLFAHHLFIEPEHFNPANKPVWQILNAPGLALDPEKDGTNSEAVIILNITEKKLLLIGLYYAGEMKKGMFSVLNFLLPAQDILPMHCAANVGKDGKTALFFGLSGTGKTTLSADPDRLLIGDDEHGWCEKGVFNFEGGCYAKCINLSAENEPVIYNAIRDGAIMENVILDPQTKLPRYEDGQLTQNTRAAYPRSYIPLRVESNRAGHPSAVIFLTCDLNGVLPPVARLSREQAAYYFLSGYTALVGSTEMGSAAAIQQTFSTCFGAPFFPRPAQVYADLLMKRLDETGASVYLVNTGWTGGAYGKDGKRFLIPTTRRIIHAIVDGELTNADMVEFPGFGFYIPKAIAGIDSISLDPRTAWSDPNAFAEQANNLIKNFNENFTKFRVSSEIAHAGPLRV